MYVRCLFVNILMIVGVINFIEIISILVFFILFEYKWSDKYIRVEFFGWDIFLWCYFVGILFCVKFLVVKLKFVVDLVVGIFVSIDRLVLVLVGLVFCELCNYMYYIIEFWLMLFGFDIGWRKGMERLIEKLLKFIVF